MRCFEEEHSGEFSIAGLMGAKFRNAGQTCVTANRILIQANI